MSQPNTSDTEQAYRRGLRGYTTGFLVALVLTVIPFTMVALGGLSKTLVVGTIAVLGIIQLLVHIRYFLHVTFDPEKREELHLIVFSGILVFIMVGGTIWILGNLHMRMMM